MRLGIPIGVIAAAAGAALAIAVAASPPAAATTTPGLYTITACSPSTSAGAWTSVDQAPASLTTTNACGGVPAIGPDDGATGAISTTGHCSEQMWSARRHLCPAAPKPAGS